MKHLLLVLGEMAHGLSAVNRKSWEGVWEDGKLIPRIHEINQLANKYSVTNLWRIWCQHQNWAWKGPPNTEVSVAIAFALGDMEACRRLVAALGSHTETVHPSFWTYESASMFSFYDWHRINSIIAFTPAIMKEDADVPDGPGLFGYVDWVRFAEYFPWEEHWARR
jgi:hypothetical protein